MESVANVVLRALTAAGVPVFGVSIRDLNDKATWRVDYNNASPAQIATAQSTITAFDLNAPAIVQQEADYEAGRRIDDRLVQALALATHQRFSDAMTLPQWKALIRAKWDALA